MVVAYRRRGQEGRNAFSIDVACFRVRDRLCRQRGCLWPLFHGVKYMYFVLAVTLYDVMDSMDEKMIES